jgi:hypothetical protein
MCFEADSDANADSGAGVAPTGVGIRHTIDDAIDLDSAGVVVRHTIDVDPTGAVVYYTIDAGYDDHKADVVPDSASQ